MQLYLLQKHLEPLIDSMGPSSSLVLILERFSKEYNLFLQMAFGLPNAAVGNPLNKQHEQIRTAVDQETKLMMEIDSYEVFIAANSLQRKLNAFRKETGISTTAIQRLLEHTQAFVKTYDIFLRQPSMKSTLDLKSVSEGWLTEIVLFRQTVHFVFSTLQVTDVELPEEYEVFSILFMSELEYKDAVRKLAAIEGIYDELCQLMNVSEAQYPLHIGKLESGSFWTKIAGQKEVVAVMVRVIGSWFDTIYRKYKLGSGLDSIPKGIDAINQTINLCGTLEEVGIDTTEIKDNAQKASVKLSKRLNILMHGQAAIELNHTLHSVGKALEEKYIEESKIVLIEQGNSANDEANEGGGFDGFPEMGTSAGDKRNEGSEEG